MSKLNEAFDAIAQGRHGDPFSVLGPHSARKNWIIRSWQPQAQTVELLDAGDQVLAKMKKVHAAGLYEARLPLPIVNYRLRLTENDHSHIIEDPLSPAIPAGGTGSPFNARGHRGESC